MKTKKVTLIQPRHIYAPHIDTNILGHIYMPNSLFAAATIMRHLDFEIKIFDENIEKLNLNTNLVGINLLGAPYIPVALDYITKIRKDFGKNIKFVLGGQIISGLTGTQLFKIFGENVFNGNNEVSLLPALGIKTNNYPDVLKISLIDTYQKISDSTLRIYLENEFSFFLSQGCKYQCSFCAADRTYKPTNSNISIRKKEEYRDFNIIEKDFKYLVHKAKSLGIDELNIYLSNLDLFQSPIELSKFAAILETIKFNVPIKLNLRGLSTVPSFLNTHRKTPYIINAIKDVGLQRIGFGIDGSTPNVWKNTKKPQNHSDCLNAIRICREEYNITPETLMVFGHNNYDDENSLKLAEYFLKEMQELYGAYPRPHISKDIVPGNDGWRDKKNAIIVNHFCDNPILFQNLDFTCTPSKFTHPNDYFRKLVTKYYTKVCNLPNSQTKYVKPLNIVATSDSNSKTIKFNEGKYDI